MSQKEDILNDKKKERIFLIGATSGLGLWTAHYLL